MLLNISSHCFVAYVLLLRPHLGTQYYFDITTLCVYPVCRKVASNLRFEGGQPAREANKTMTPHRGNTIFFCSSQQLPRTLEGLFELTRHPSQALDSPRALLLELQRYKDTVRCAALGAEVPGHRQKQLTQTLIVRLLKTHFFTQILDCEKSTEYS